MINNEIFKEAENKLANALNVIEVESQIAEMLIKRKIRHSYQMIELEDMIKKYNLKVEKLSKKTFEFANRIFSDIFVGDNFQKDDGGNVYVKLDNGTNVLLTFLNNLTLDEHVRELHQESKNGFELKTVEDLEFFINNLSSEKIRNLVENSLSGLENVRNNINYFGNESKERLNRAKRILSVTNKLKVKDFEYIKKLKRQKEIYENNYENYILSLPVLLEIEEKLNNAKTALNDWRKLFNEVPIAIYKDTVKIRDSYVHYKETLISDIKKSSTDVSFAKFLKSKENVNNIIKKCITKEEIEALKKDPEFLIELGTIRKSKIQNKATKLLVSYLVNAIAPKEQEISK